MEVAQSVVRREPSDHKQLGIGRHPSSVTIIKITRRNGKSPGQRNYRTQTATPSFIHKISAAAIGQPGCILRPFCRLRSYAVKNCARRYDRGCTKYKSAPLLLAPTFRVVVAFERLQFDTEL